MKRKQQKAAEDFVERFAAAWADPSTEALCALFTEDVRLVTPRMPDFIGQHDARVQFDALLQMAPGIRAEVHNWAANEDQLFMEVEFHVTRDDATFSWMTVNRFTLRDGKASERVAWFDPEPVLAELEKQ